MFRSTISKRGGDFGGTSSSSKRTCFPRITALISSADETLRVKSVWRPLFQSTYPAIDLSLCSTRLPFYFTSPVINTIAPIDTSSRSSIDEVVRLLSKLSRILSSPFATSAQELQHLSSELMLSERALAAGDHGIIWKVMLYHGLLSIQSVGEETTGTRIMEETEWAQRASESYHLFSISDSLPEQQFEAQVVCSISLVKSLRRIKLIAFLPSSTSSKEQS